MLTASFEWTCLGMTRLAERMDRGPSREFLEVAALASEELPRVLLLLVVAGQAGRNRRKGFRHLSVPSTGVTATKGGSLHPDSRLGTQEGKQDDLMRLMLSRAVH